MKGKLIVIEGIDACGKETQTSLLIEKFKKEGLSAVRFSFPDYSTSTGKKIKQKLHQQKHIYSNPLTDGFAELFALNLKEKREELVNYLQRGFYIISDRYEPSNEAYQSAKLPEKDRRFFKNYIRELYFKKYKVPKPNLIIFLNLAPKLCTILMKNRKKIDAYERNLAFLEKVYSIYLNLSHENNWISVECSLNKNPSLRLGTFFLQNKNPSLRSRTLLLRNKKILPKEEIAQKIWQKIKPKLNL